MRTLSLPDLRGNAGKFLKVSADEQNVEWAVVSGSGTVTSVGSADGSITVTNPTTTPDLKVIKAITGFTVTGGDLVVTGVDVVGLVESISFEDSGTSIAAQTYTLELSAAYPYTINTLNIIAGAGSCTAAVQINGTPVTGISAVSVSTTIATATGSAANAVAIGDKVTLVISSPTTLDNLQASLKTTRTT